MVGAHEGETREQRRKRQAREAGRRWRAANPEKMRQSRRASLARRLAANPDAVREQQRRWREANPEKVQQYRRSMKRDPAKRNASNTRWIANNPEKWRAIRSAWLRKRPENVMNGRVARRMRMCLQTGKGRAPWSSLVPYTVEELRRHLERQFVRGMSWENMGRWHIDHIVPLSSFSFSSPSDPDFQVAWSLANLRPLWARRNLRKSAKRELLL